MSGLRSVFTPRGSLNQGLEGHKPGTLNHPALQPSPSPPAAGCQAAALPSPGCCLPPRGPGHPPVFLPTRLSVPTPRFSLTCTRRKGHPGIFITAGDRSQLAAASKVHRLGGGGGGRLGGLRGVFAQSNAAISTPRWKIGGFSAGFVSGFDLKIAGWCLPRQQPPGLIFNGKRY